MKTLWEFVLGMLFSASPVLKSVFCLCRSHKYRIISSQYFAVPVLNKPMTPQFTNFCSERSQSVSCLKQLKIVCYITKRWSLIWIITKYAESLTLLFFRSNQGVWLYILIYFCNLATFTVWCLSYFVIATVLLKFCVNSLQKAVVWIIIIHLKAFVGGKKIFLFPFHLLLRL